MTEMTPTDWVDSTELIGESFVIFDQFDMKRYQKQDGSKAVSILRYWMHTGVNSGPSSSEQLNLDPLTHQQHSSVSILPKYLKCIDIHFVERERA